MCMKNTINRTIFGIETAVLQVGGIGLINLSIEPFLELKRGRFLRIPQHLQLSIEPFLELKRKNNRSKLKR